MSSESPNPGSPSSYPKNERLEHYRKESMIFARRFYAADSQLTGAQREQLKSSFWTQCFVFPILGLPVIVGAIMLPNWYVKKGSPIRKTTKFRVAQITLGFVGVFGGQAFARSCGYYANMSRFSDPNQRTCWTILAKAPPNIGLQYYVNTSKHPELAMKNPDSMDWNHNLLFPMCLIFKEQRGMAPPYMRGSNPQATEDQWKDRWRSQRTDGNAPQQVPSDQEPDVGNSWSKVLNANREPAQPSSRPPSEQEEKQRAFDAMIDKARGGTWDTDISEEQKKFDALLEKERQGGSDSVL